MSEGEHLLTALKGYGGYSTTITIIVFGLLGWWKVLPALIDAISNRQSKIEERMGLLLDTATQRFERQLEAADRRHDECMESHEAVTRTLDEVREELRQQKTIVVEQQREIHGLKRQIVQMRRSGAALAGAPVPEQLAPLVDLLDEVTMGGEG